MQMTRFVFFRLEKHFNDDPIESANLRHHALLLSQRISISIISKTQIISRSVIHLKKNRKNKPVPPPDLPPEEKQPIEEQPKKQPFLKRLLFGEETPDLSELEAGSTTILDILSPTSVDTKSRDYIVVDGICYAKA